MDNKRLTVESIDIEGRIYIRYRSEEDQRYR